MARSHKEAVAAAQAAKDRQFRAFQEELGLSSDNDGEALAPSTPQKAAAWRPVARSPQQCDGGGTGETSHPGGAAPLLLGPDSHWFLTLLVQQART
jgi:hypothetical protein